MLRLYHVLLGVIVLALTPIGINLTRSHFKSTNSLQPPTVAKSAVKTQNQSTSPISANSVQGNIWKSMLGKTEAPADWRVEPCEAKETLLCVSSGEGKILGTVELGLYPLGQQADFQKMLIAAGIPPNANVDYQSPKYQTQILTALKSWIAEHYSDLSKDRLVSYGDRISFSPKPPELAFVGKLQGMRYGFSGVLQRGGVQEQHLGYIAFDGNALYVITTAFNPTSVTGKFETLQNFQQFEPHLSAIVADLKLPK